MGSKGQNTTLWSQGSLPPAHHLPTLENTSPSLAFLPLLRSHQRELVMHGPVWQTPTLCSPKTKTKTKTKTPHPHN
eukprot:12404508-Karenia_brevis.AAC.1